MQTSSNPFSVLLFAGMSLLAGIGCVSSMPAQTNRARINAIEVPAAQRDAMWERAVAVLKTNHFEIARESRIEGIIETHYRAGSGLLEPWHPDSVGYAQRLESTIQSIRRRVTITFQSTSPDTLMISARVEKEIEDVPGLAAGYEGGATFSEADPLERNLDQVVGQTGQSRWLPWGPDPDLEHRLISQIRTGRF